VKPFHDRYKRVAQNILKRKEKERKEKLEKQKEKLLYESLELEEEEEAVNSSPTETTKNDQQPLQSLPNNNNTSKKPIQAKPSIFEKLHWKTTFQETSQEMKGKALYDIYVPPLPPPVVDPTEEEKMKKNSKKRKSEGVDEKKEREQQEAATTALEAAKKWENDYLQKLFDQTTAVDTNMSSRIHPPAGLLENYPIAQLLVMDVYLQLPKPNKQLPPESANARRGSVASSSTPAALFPVEIHQIIGIFPAENAKCPANLDCGLFDYEYFHGLYEEQQRRLLDPQSYNDDDNQSVGSNSSLASSLTGVTNTGGGAGGALTVNQYMMKEKSFSAPDQNTGISAGKTRLSSVINSGMEFRYHLLGQWPNKEYLEKNLPRKVKNWLGLPV
jgi:hypothetical protein